MQDKINKIEFKIHDVIFMKVLKVKINRMHKIVQF